MIRRLGLLCLLAAFIGLSAQTATQQAKMPSTAGGDWPHYTADVKGTQYSPLDQINTANFKTLEVARRFKTDVLGPRQELNLEGKPDAVNAGLDTRAGPAA